ncbi:leucine-rich repeat protein soc-2-like [Ylistrum balloti]|uniref:leucine-rich repeat protein soc-2-like n=1 Tax=Ylistrum balloti TaxID=509963 RepID=UPI0029059DE9|nr:leucine-rich repeat protein soc-2-like [Ylistrum balloti]
MEFLGRACRHFKSKGRNGKDTNEMIIDGKKISTVLELHNLLSSCTNPKMVIQFTMTGAPIKSVPQCIGSFVNISYLNLSGNNIEFLPWSIVLLKKLEHLDLSNNCVAVISPILCYFPLLKTLDVSENVLESLPTDLLNLVALKTLNVIGNKTIKSPPLSVCQDGKEAIFEALRIRKSRVDAFSNWKPYYQGNKTQSMKLNSLVQICIDCIIESDVDFLSAEIPPVMKTYLNETKKQESSLLPNLFKCSKCRRYFTKSFTFENHDCKVVNKMGTLK